MKKFFCLMALFMAAPVASAMDVEFGGQHRARGVYYQQDMTDIFIQRFKFTGAFRPNEMFESHFSVMTNYKWGNSFLDNEVRVYGYGDWKMTDELMLRVGRSSYQVADGSSLGMNDYEEYPNVMDGGTLTYNTESLAVDLWGAYLSPNYEGGAEAGKYNASVGLSLDVRALPEEFKMANLHIMYVFGSETIQVKEDGSTSSSDLPDQVRLGLGIGGDVSGLDYKLVGMAHSDPEDITNLLEYAVDGQVGYTLDFDARIYVGGHYESEAYDPFYYNRHARSGILDVAQWGKGTIYGEGGIAYMPSEDFEIGIRGLYFHSIGSWGKYGNNGKNPESDEAFQTEQVIEADLYVKKSYAGGFSIKLHGGLFDLAAEKPYWQAQLNTTFDF